MLTSLLYIASVALSQTRTRVWSGDDKLAMRPVVDEDSGDGCTRGKSERRFLGHGFDGFEWVVAPQRCTGRVS